MWRHLVSFFRTILRHKEKMNLVFVLFLPPIRYRRRDSRRPSCGRWANCGATCWPSDRRWRGWRRCGPSRPSPRRRRTPTSWRPASAPTSSRWWRGSSVATPPSRRRRRRRRPTDAWPGSVRRRPWSVLMLNTFLMMP